jgi:ribonuclease-3
MQPSNDVEATIGYQFTNRSLLEEALVTAGNEHPCNKTEVGKPANKRLALVGDAVLRLAIVDRWWEQGDTSRRMG